MFSGALCPSLWGPQEAQGRHEEMPTQPRSVRAVEVVSGFRVGEQFVPRAGPELELWVGGFLLWACLEGLRACACVCIPARAVAVLLPAPPSPLSSCHCLSFSLLVLSLLRRLLSASWEPLLLAAAPSLPGEQGNKDLGGSRVSSNPRIFKRPLSKPFKTQTGRPRPRKRKGLAWVPRGAETVSPRRLYPVSGSLT